MNAFTLFSFLVLVGGIIVFGIGLILYWTTNPVTYWADAAIIIGLLFLLGSIMMLCVSVQY